jgi:hypothetical protein
MNQITEEPSSNVSRENCITAERLLASISQQRDERRATFVHTGVGKHLIKEEDPLYGKTSDLKSFLMGSDKHTSNEIGNLTMLKKNYQFDVVANNFPLIEDRVLLILFLTISVQRR